MTRTDLASEVGTGNDARPADEGATSRDSATWTIGQIAEEFAITHRTVRHYEELNLISPERRGTARIYRRRERTRLNLILRGKRLGFPLEEIRTIIDLYDEPTGQGSQLRYVLDQIHDRRGHLERRRRDRRGHLERRRRDVEDALNELDEFERRCQSDLEKLDELGQQPGSSSA